MQAPTDFEKWETGSREKIGAAASGLALTSLVSARVEAAAGRSHDFFTLLIRGSCALTQMDTPPAKLTRFTVSS